MIKSLLAGLLLLCLAPIHEFHVSKTNVRYVADREQIQVEMHVFLDDLEKALSEVGAPNLYIGTKEELPQTPQVILRYLNNHFKINWNGQEIPNQLLGYEMSDDLQALWIYLAADSKEAPENVTIQNTVLTEVFSDQRNMVKVFAGEESITLLTSLESTKAKYNF